MRLAWQLDWKVIAIAGSDEHAKDINDVGDIEKYYPGTVSGIREWFRWYKTPGGALAAPPAQNPPWGGREDGWKASCTSSRTHVLASPSLGCRTPPLPVSWSLLSCPPKSPTL